MSRYPYFPTRGVPWGLIEDAQEASRKVSEQRILDKLREAVNEECSCGGCGPDDPQACQACMVWHRVTGGEG